MSNNFNAKKARAITNVAKKNELDTILVAIEKQAEKGEFSLSIGADLELETIDILEKRGFKIFGDEFTTIISW